MKTAGRRTSNRWATVPSNRAPGAGGQNRSCSIQWAEKQEKLQPAQKCFFLTSTFIKPLGEEPQIAGPQCPASEHLVRAVRTDPAPSSGLRSKKSSSLRRSVFS